jgi:amidophosphoribosyltransferase
MSEGLKHECGVAMVVLRRPPSATRRVGDNAPYHGDFGGTKLSLLLEKQHNRGQDGAGAAVLCTDPEPGTPPYWSFKSASSTPLVDVLGMIAKRPAVKNERIFLGHLRYATFGRNEVSFCHPFIHEASELCHTVLLAGNFNLTNAPELFDDYRHHGSFPTSRSDGYLLCEMIARELGSRSTRPSTHVARALSTALANADGAWTLCGMTGDGWAFATRDPHGIRPGWYYMDDDVVVVASERPAIQAAFDVPPEAVKELPPGEALVVSPKGEVVMSELSSDIRTDDIKAEPRPCAFERIYFSRANDADIHRERKALGAALVPQILKAANASLEDIFFSYIPNSARIAFHGLLEKLFNDVFSRKERIDRKEAEGGFANSAFFAANKLPRFGEVAVKDAKFRTFIADAAARREFYKHVYDVTYGLVRPGKDTLVVLDDSIVRGNTMRNAILPMLDRLGPKRIVVASSAPPIRYPDCYGIDMSTLGELVAFKALVNLLDGERGIRLRQGYGGQAGNGERELRRALDNVDEQVLGQGAASQLNPLAPLYARFSEEEHAAEIARLLTPPDMKAEVVVVYQTVDALRQCLATTQQPNHSTTQPKIGDWYFTGDYPTPGGYKVLHKALLNYLDRRQERSY